MVGLTFSRKNGSSSLWWVNDGRYKRKRKKEESKQCEREGGDTHLSHSCKWTVSSTQRWNLVLVEKALIEESFILRTLSHNFLYVSHLNEISFKRIEWSVIATLLCCCCCWMIEWQTHAVMCHRKQNTHSTLGVGNRAHLTHKHLRELDIVTHHWVFKNKQGKYQRQR